LSSYVFYPDDELLTSGSDAAPSAEHMTNNNPNTYKANTPDTVLNAPVLKGAFADEYTFIGWRDQYTAIDPEDPASSYTLNYHIPPSQEHFGELRLAAGWQDSQGNIVE